MASKPTSTDRSSAMRMGMLARIIANITGRLIAITMKGSDEMKYIVCIKWTCGMFTEEQVCGEYKSANMANTAYKILLTKGYDVYVRREEK